MPHRDERRSSTTKRIRETEADAVVFVACSAIVPKWDQRHRVVFSFAR